MAFIHHVMIGGPGGQICIKCGLTGEEMEKLSRLCPGYIVVCSERPNLMKALGRRGNKMQVLFSLI